MKKVMFGAILALGMVACGETAPAEEVSTVNTEAVLEMEAASDAVAEGTEVLDAEVEELAEEMGDLLNAL
jgi:hypothetical protein